MRTTMTVKPDCRHGVLSAVTGLFCLCLASTVVLGEDQFLDDHGDDSANATPLTLGAAAVNGDIEMEVDRDCFSFPAQAGKQYVVTVTETSVPDVSVRVRSQASSGSILVEGHSVGGNQVIVTWPNTFGSHTVYAEVVSFAQFTNGTYTIRVDEQDLDDTDGDDLPDAWEMHYFGDLDEDGNGDYDGDGNTNYEEYLLGSDPTVAEGIHLEITALNALGSTKTITWDATPLRRYEVQTSSEIMSPTWTALGVVTSQTTTASYDDTNANGHCIYRVELLP